MGKSKERWRYKRLGGVTGRCPLFVLLVRLFTIGFDLGEREP